MRELRSRGAEFTSVRDNLHHWSIICRSKECMPTIGQRVETDTTLLELLDEGITLLEHVASNVIPDGHGNR
jgi:hypothetical protein